MAKLINLIPANQKPKTNEALEDMEVALPSKVEKFLDRLVQTIKSYNLPKKKEQAVIARVMDSMGITTSELNQAVQKLKKYDVVKRQRTGNDDHDFMGENLKEAKGEYPKVIKGTYTIELESERNQRYSIKFGNEEVDTYMLGGVFDGKFQWIGSSGCDCGDFFNALVKDANKGGKFKK